MGSWSDFQWWMWAFALSGVLLLLIAVALLSGISALVRKVEANQRRLGVPQSTVPPGQWSQTRTTTTTNPPPAV